jgi:hypothetical protein
VNIRAKIFTPCVDFINYFYLAWASSGSSWVAYCPPALISFSARFEWPAVRFSYLASCCMRMDIETILGVSTCLSVRGVLYVAYVMSDLPVVCVRMKWSVRRCRRALSGCLYDCPCGVASCSSDIRVPWYNKTACADSPQIWMFGCQTGPCWTVCSKACGWVLNYPYWMPSLQSLSGLRLSFCSVQFYICVMLEWLLGRLWSVWL